MPHDMVFGRCNYVLNAEAQFLQQLLDGRRCPETFDTAVVAFAACVLAPAEIGCDLDGDEHENLITVCGGVDPWKNRLGYQDPEAAYLLLLDQDGRVVWKHAAQQVAESAFDRLQRAAATALSQRQQPVPAQR